MRKNKSKKQASKKCSLQGCSHSYHKMPVYYRDGKYWCNKECWKKSKEKKEKKNG